MNAADLCDRLTLEEKLDLLTGPSGFWEGMADLFERGPVEPFPTTGVPRLGVPGFAFSDGPRGVVVGNATCFPVSMAQGASWDGRY